MSEKTKATESSQQDRLLVDAALAGDQKAYQNLAGKYERALNYHILKLVRNQDIVEDLVQEVLLKAFDGLESYNREYAFSTWVYRIATNHSIDYLRKKKMATLSIDEPVKGKDSDMKMELTDEEAGTDYEVLRKERSELIRKAIENLPEKFRTVIHMRHMDELSYEEISEILNIPLGTVKAHIFRARELLNKYLKDRLSAY